MSILTSSLWYFHVVLTAQFTQLSNPGYPRDRRLVGPQIRPGGTCIAGNRTWAVQHVARRYNDWGLPNPSTGIYNQIVGKEFKFGRPHREVLLYIYISFSYLIIETFPLRTLLYVILYHWSHVPWFCPSHLPHSTSLTPQPLPLYHPML